MRSVEIILASENLVKAQSLLRRHQIEVFWTDDSRQGQVRLKYITQSEEAEQVFDAFEKQFAGDHFFRIVIYSIEATIPRMKEEEEPEINEQKKEAFIRISREELYADMQEAVVPSNNFMILMALSAVVAGVGLLQDSVAITIGAMVIAPLIGPQVSLGFATTLGDWKMIRKSILTAAIGTAIALGISVIWGMVDPSVEILVGSQHINYSYLVLALASGAAGVFSVIRGISTALVGVMVAVALLPPLVSTGLLLGGGYWLPAFYVLLIFVANIICINLAAVLTFVAVGIRPNSWWEAKKAKEQTVKAVLLWTFLLLLLVAIIYITS